MTELLSLWVCAMRAVVLAGCLAALAACSTTGNSFSSMGLKQIIPGQTTLEQASDLLGGPPVVVYRRQNGACIARWAHSFTWVTDAAYLRQELWLQFGADGTFQRVVKKINLPYGIHPGGGQPPRDVGAFESARTQATSAGGMLAVPPNTTSPVWTQPLHDTVMTYPVSN